MKNQKTSKIKRITINKNFNFFFDNQFFQFYKIKSFLKIIL